MRHGVTDARAVRFRSLLPQEDWEASIRTPRSCAWQPHGVAVGGASCVVCSSTGMVPCAGPDPAVTSVVMSKMTAPLLMQCHAQPSCATWAAYVLQCMVPKHAAELRWPGGSWGVSSRCQRGANPRPRCTSLGLSPCPHPDIPGFSVERCFTAHVTLAILHAVLKNESWATVSPRDLLTTPFGVCCSEPCV